MGGEEMDADSNNNHDQTAFPQATGGFNFTAPTAGMYWLDLYSSWQSRDLGFS
jgi:hypothetical protein